MKVLTAWAILAKSILKILFTRFCFIIRVKMLFILKFIRTMSK